MPYLLDTNVVIRQLNGDPVTRSLVRELTPAGVAVSTITVIVLVARGVPRCRPADA